MSDRKRRLRALASEWWRVAVAALVVLALVGGWVTYGAHVEPGTTTEQRVASSWEATGDFEHRAVVTRENPVFPVGTELANRSTYFTRVSPALRGEFTTGYRAASAEDVTVSVRSTLVLESASESQTYWQVNRTLAEETARGVAPGSTVAVPFSLNASRVDARLENITRSLGDAPGATAAAVAVTVRVDGIINGRQQSTVFSARLPVSVGGDTYTVTSPTGVGERTERTETVSVPVDPGPLRSLGGPFLLVGSVAGLAWMGAARRRGDFEVSETDRARLDYLADRREFDDWITTFRLPAEALDHPTAEAASLADLVDYAIDTDSGVVAPPDESAFYVVDDPYLYVYRPPDVAAGDAGPPAPDDPEPDEPPVATGRADGGPTADRDDG